jgi:hypothetical protein
LIKKSFNLVGSWDPVQLPLSMSVNILQFTLKQKLTVYYPAVNFIPSLCVVC